MRRLFAMLAVLMFAAIFFGLVKGYSERQTRSPLAEYYLTQVPRELGAPNVVTGILITYRGFDTLGEVAVLFMVAASVGVLLGSKPGEKVHAQRRQVAKRAGRANSSVPAPRSYCRLFSCSAPMSS